MFSFQKILFSLENGSKPNKSWDSKYYFLTMEMVESARNFFRGLFGFEPFSDQNKIFGREKFWETRTLPAADFFVFLSFSVLFYIDLIATSNICYKNIRLRCTIVFFFSFILPSLITVLKRFLRNFRLRRIFIVFYLFCLYSNEVLNK